MVARKTLHAELVPQSFRMVRRSFLGRGEVGVGLGLLWALTCELVPHERILYVHESRLLGLDHENRLLSDAYEK